MEWYVQHLQYFSINMEKIIFIICMFLFYHKVKTSAVSRWGTNQMRNRLSTRVLLARFWRPRPSRALFTIIYINTISQLIQSVIFLVAKIAAVTTTTTKSITITRATDTVHLSRTASAGIAGLTTVRITGCTMGGTLPPPGSTPTNCQFFYHAVLTFDVSTSWKRSQTTSFV